MIHMFDYCRNNVELNNIKHLACTEIRAANLCHCTFLGAFIKQTASPFNFKKAHQVKDNYPTWKYNFMLYNFRI